MTVLIAGMLAVVIFSLAYYMALNAYQIESEDQKTIFVMGNENLTDRVDMDARITSIDPLKGEARLRISLQPKGNLSQIQGFASARRLKLLSPGAAKADGLGETVFERGRLLTPVELSYSLEGQANDYPFDRHTAMIVLALNQTDPDRTVPSVLWFRGNVPGFSFNLQPVEDIPTGVRALNLTITRSSTVIKAATAGMVVMWAIGLGVLVLILMMLMGWFNMNMLTLFAALLFGLFSLRSSLPGTPPIGTYSDFLAFLWVEGIVALALIAAIAATLKHRPF